MTGQDDTRRVGGPDLQKTRLIRREGEVRENRVVPDQPLQPEARTRLAFRPKPEPSENAAPQEGSRFVCGWLVVVAGPGRGNFAAIHDGMNSIGRAEDQATRIDFGDDTISRSEHAFVTYDYRGRKFYLQHGGKASVVRLNGRPVLQPVDLNPGDRISLGATELVFMAFCGEAFDWQE